MLTRYFAIFASVVVAVGLALAVFVVNRGGGDDQFAECHDAVISGGSASVGGPFSLIDNSGKRVTDSDVITGPTIFYFGYTFCPDVCPLDNSRNAEAVDILKDRGIAVTPVFVTIDPARDTPEVMNEYVSYLQAGMIGLTGSDADIAKVAKEYRVYYSKNGSGEDYLMNHSTFSYLMAPGVGFLDFFSRDVTAKKMADRVGCFVDRI